MRHIAHRLESAVVDANGVRVARVFRLALKLDVLAGPDSTLAVRVADDFGFDFSQELFAWDYRLGGEVHGWTSIG